MKLDLPLSNINEAIEILIDLTKRKFLTIDHKELFKYIHHLDDMDCFYNPCFAALANFLKIYPQLTTFTFTQLPIKITLSRLENYYYLVNINDISFQKKLVDLIAKIKIFRMHFSFLVQSALDQKIITKDNIGLLEHVPDDQLVLFFAENLSANMQKLADFNINETTEFAKLKQKYPEING